MIKNLTVLVTNRCNSRCMMCSIWKSGISSEEMDIKSFRKLFSIPDFKEVEELSVSGGEPFLRQDLEEIVDSAIGKMPKLQRLFIVTNGTNPERVKKFLNDVSGKIKEIYLAVSIEGNKGTNRKVRGIDSYNSALSTIELCNKLAPNIHISISMTLTPLNCNENSLMHVKKIADKTGSTYSFREAASNETYYHNSMSNLALSLSQKEIAIDHIKKFLQNDPFMRIQSEYFKTGKVPLMGDKETGVKCHAGDIFVLVRPDGSIYPCINSSRKIGDLKKGLFIKKITDLGKYEQCPCCTECCVYPTLTWSSYCEK